MTDPGQRRPLGLHLDRTALGVVRVDGGRTAPRSRAGSALPAGPRGSHTSAGSGGLGR
jgi:hypothetical protein